MRTSPTSPTGRTRPPGLTGTAHHGSSGSSEALTAAAVVGTVAVVTVAVGAVGAVVAREAAAVAQDAPATEAVRAILVAGGIASGTWLVVRRRVLDAGRVRLRAAAAAGAAIGYLLDPFAWSGSALVARPVVGAGAAAWLLDLVLWCALACAAALVATRRAGERAVGYGPSAADGDARPPLRGTR
jgi:hypothetical protein